MYNRGYLQFFCNWGDPTYLLALEELESIKAVQAKIILDYGEILNNDSIRLSTQDAFTYKRYWEGTFAGCKGTGSTSLSRK